MKTIAVTLIAFMAVIGLSTGCNPKGTTSGSGDSLATDTVVFDPMPECEGLQAKQFCWAGLDFIGLGDSLTWKTYPAPPGGTFKDTVFSDTVHSESGMQITDWNVRMINFASGKVYLEADFDTGHMLNRIRIETPEYTMKNGLRVGSDVEDVRKAFEGEVLRTGPFEEFGVMEVTRSVLMGSVARTIIFHFPLGRWYQAGQDSYDVSVIPAGVKATRIVLM